MPQAIRLPPQPARCELCGRAAPLTRHHLIPRSLHDKAYVRKKFDRVSRITATLWVCRPCHNHIHQTFDEKTLALEYNSRELLLSDARIRQFVDWLAAKPDGFMPKR